MATEPQLGEAATMAIKPVCANIFARSATAPALHAEASPAAGAFASDAARQVTAARRPRRAPSVRAAAVALTVLVLVVVLVPRLVSGAESSTRAIEPFRVLTAAPRATPPVRVAHRPRHRRHRPSRRSARHRLARRRSASRPAFSPRRPPARAVPAPPLVAPRQGIPAPVPAPRPAREPKRPIPASVPDGSPPEFL